MPYSWLGAWGEKYSEERRIALNQNSAEERRITLNQNSAEERRITLNQNSAEERQITLNQNSADGGTQSGKKTRKDSICLNSITMRC